MATNAPSGTLNDTSRSTVRWWLPLSYSLVNWRATSMGWSEKWERGGRGPGGRCGEAATDGTNAWSADAVPDDVRRRRRSALGRAGVLMLLLVHAAVAPACGDAGTARQAPSRGPAAAVADAARPDSITGGALAAQPGGDSVARPAGDRPVVLFIGTSLTAGLGLDPAEAYPQRVAELAEAAGTPIEVVNAGLSGETSAGALRRADWVLRTPADVVVIETGANDGLRGLSPASTRANLEAIVTKVRAAQPAARVVLVQMEAPPNLGEAYTREFREMYPAVARTYEIPLVPFLLEGIAGRAELNQADGIHPTAEGARLAARTVWGTLGPVVRALPGA